MAAERWELGDGSWGKRVLRIVNICFQFAVVAIRLVLALVSNCLLVVFANMFATICFLIILLTIILTIRVIMICNRIIIIVRKVISGILSLIRVRIITRGIRIGIVSTRPVFVLLRLLV